MQALLAYAALGCIAAGLVAGAVTLVLGRNFRDAFRFAMDFWLAAGLLRLGLTPGWEPVLVAATIVAIRQLVGLSLSGTAVRTDLAAGITQRGPDKRGDRRAGE